MTNQMKITLDSQQLNMLRSRISILHGLDKNGIVNIRVKDVIELLSSSSNLYVELVSPCNVLDKGECNINVDILTNLLKHIRSSSDITLSTDNNDLLIKSSMMGSIREPCSQSTLSKHRSNVTKPLISGLELIRGISSFRGKTMRLIIKEDKASLYGMYGISCVGKYVCPINRTKGNDDVLNIIITPIVSRILPILGEDITIGVKDKHIDLSSNTGRVSIGMETDQVYDFDILDSVLEYESMASISINTNTLKDVLHWHRYKSNAGHSIQLSTSDNNLRINSKSLIEDSLIPSGDVNGLLDITISMDNLSTTLDRLSLSTTSVLEQKSINLKGGGTYNLLVVRNEDSNTLGIINEQAT